jgi:hypothetical protein
MEKQDITNINSARSNDSNTNDNELILHDNNVGKNDKKLADQLSVNSEIPDKTTEDPKDPKHWSRKKKNLILFIISSAGMIAPLSSTYVKYLFYEQDLK